MKSRDTRTMREKRSERFKRIDRNRCLDKIYELIRREITFKGFGLFLNNLNK